MSERAAIWILTVTAMVIAVTWMVGLFLLGVRSGGLLVVGPFLALAASAYGVGVVTVHYGEIRRRHEK